MCSISPPSPQTLAGSSPPPEGIPPGSLDLSVLPPIFVLPAHFKGDELHDVEKRLMEQNAPLTLDASEAKLFIGKVGTKRRAAFELRSHHVWTEELISSSLVSHPPISEDLESAHKKRRFETASASRSETLKLRDEESTTKAETEDKSFGLPVNNKIRHISPILVPDLNQKPKLPSVPFEGENFVDAIKVVKLDWLDNSNDAGKFLPLGEYVVYSGRPVDRTATAVSSQLPTASLASQSTHKIISSSQKVTAERPQSAQSILKRAKADHSVAPAQKSGQRPHRSTGHGSRRFDNRTFASQSQKQGHPSSQIANILQQTTSDYEGESSDISEPPNWVKAGLKYACQRSTPADPPNDPFIEQLKKIRKARLLTGDEIGVRAYSTSIAALVAYPYLITNPREILGLPGCDVKIANLWIEWKNTGIIIAAEDAENDEVMRVLRLFYDIWGVGASTAREFYFSNHWRDLDDIVEHGWSTLSRVQQIGVKYYAEFLEQIPRSEVESIASIIHTHAIRVRDSNISVTIVGGYRRGKSASGDVDIILSHPSLPQTTNLVTDIVASLEDEGWITHTLLLSLHGTHRGQATLPFRSSGHASYGFDTLDKALVVWQDLHWPTREADLTANSKAKNPNIHRRVDIIVSPWRTVGCAVAGWSGGTTFQRDLRRYAKHVKGWKFDSSGVRDRSTGRVVELEGPMGVTGTAEEAERKVFEGMGLPYIEPWERCTG